MSSPLHHLAATQDDNLVAVTNRAEAMSDDQASTAAAAKVVVDQFFRLRIKSAGRFVEDHNAWAASQRARDLQPLTLSAAKIPPAFLDPGIVSAVALDNIVVDSGVFCGLN